MELYWSQCLLDKKTKLKICSQVHTTAKYVVLRRRKDENGCKLQKWKMHVQSVQNSFLTMQICDILVVVVA